MSWRDGLRRVEINGALYVGASFRGVPFFVDDADTSGGRRIVVHEFPHRDQPFVEDMGSRAVTMRINAHLIGDDYETQRNTLLSAFDAGAGDLVHPYLGRMRAVCSSWSTRHSKSDGGMVTLAIEMTRISDAAPAPEVEADPVSGINALSRASISAAKSEQERSYSASGMPSFALSSVEESVKDIATRLESSLSPVAATAEEAAALSGRLHLLSLRSASLVRQPLGVFDALQEAIEGLADTAIEQPQGMLDALIYAYSYAVGALAPETTLTRRRERANQIAHRNSTRQLFASWAARILPTIPHADIDSAVADRNRVVAMLDEQAQLASDTVYPSLVALRSEVVRLIPRERDAAKVESISVRVATPAILLAYRQYGAASKDTEILTRNHIQHPGTVIGDVKVLRAR